MQVKAGFFRLAKFNAPEWYHFVAGSIGSAILGGIMPGFAFVSSSQEVDSPPAAKSSNAIPHLPNAAWAYCNQSIPNRRLTPSCSHLSWLTINLNAAGCLLHYQQLFLAIAGAPEAAGAHLVRRVCGHRRGCIASRHSAGLLLYPDGCPPDPACARSAHTQPSCARCILLIPCLWTQGLQM